MQQAIATIEDGNAGESDPNNYDNIITTKEAKTTDAFSSRVIHAKMKIAYQGEGTNIITQALLVKDGSLPQALQCRTPVWSCARVAKKSLW